MIYNIVFVELQFVYGMCTISQTYGCYMLTYKRAKHCVSSIEMRTVISHMLKVWEGVTTNILTSIFDVNMYCLIKSHWFKRCIINKLMVGLVVHTHKESRYVWYYESHNVNILCCIHAKTNVIQIWKKLELINALMMNIILCIQC